MANALILPPLHPDATDVSVRKPAAAMGSLLDGMARGLHERRHTDRPRTWPQEGRHREERVTQAHEDVRRGRKPALEHTVRHARSRVPKGQPPVHGGGHCAPCTMSHPRSAASPGPWPTTSATGTRTTVGGRFLDRYATTREAAGEAVASFGTYGPAAGPDCTVARDRLRRRCIEKDGEDHHHGDRDPFAVSARVLQMAVVRDHGKVGGARRQPDEHRAGQRQRRGSDLTRGGEACGRADASRRGHLQGDTGDEQEQGKQQAAARPHGPPGTEIVRPCHMPLPPSVPSPHLPRPERIGRPDA